MAVSNGPIGHWNPAIATVNAHAPVHPGKEGKGYAACRALRKKYIESANTDMKLLQLQRHTRGVSILGSDNLDPARLAQKLRSIKRFMILSLQTH